MASNWGIAAGLGQGIMQGLQFNRQMDADKRSQQALDNQTAAVDMQKQIHGERMGAFNRDNEERQRVETLGNLKTGIEANYQDMPDYRRQQMFVDYGLQTGVMKPADLDAAKKLRDNMVQMAGPEAYQAVIRGDIKPMQQLLGTKGYDIQTDAKSGNFLLRVPGSDAVQSIDKAGLLQLDAMATYRDQLAAREKSALDSRKTLADIRLKEASANLKDRLPQDRFGIGGVGVGVGRGGGSSDGKSKDGFPFDFKDAEAVAPVNPDTGKADPQKVANLLASAQNMHALNPGLRETPAVFMQIGAGLERGDFKPEPIYDPATNTYFKGVKYGDGAVRIGSESDIDPDKFYGDKPATNSVRVAADRAWLPQYLGSLNDPKQRASIESAIKADTPVGKAARKEIIDAYSKAKASGAEIPLFVSQAYNALRTGDRLKTAPAEKNPAAPTQKAPDAPKDFSMSGKPSYEAFLDASDKLEKVKDDAQKMSPDRREVYLANRVPELEALVKHHSQYLNYR